MKGPRILLVTGKGGVGKSTVAAAAAIKLSQQGRKVLLAELGEKSFFQYVFDQPISYKPQPVGENLWACIWEGEQCLKEYIAHLLKIEKIVDLFFENKVMRALVQAAPALKELAILGKLTSPHRKVGPALDFDDIVLDAYSTGHFKALLQAPRGMGEAIPFGPMGEQCRAIDRVIQDREISQVWVVSLPEELPVIETLEHLSFLKAEMGLQPQAILNRYLPTQLDKSDCDMMPEAASSNSDFVSYICSEAREFEKSKELLEADLKAEIPHMLEGMSKSMLEKLSERIPLPWKTS